MLIHGVPIFLAIVATLLGIANIVSCGIQFPQRSSSREGAYLAVLALVGWVLVAMAWTGGGFLFYITLWTLNLNAFIQGGYLMWKNRAYFLKKYGGWLPGRFKWHALTYLVKQNPTDSLALPWAQKAKPTSLAELKVWLAHPDREVRRVAISRASQLKSGRS